MRLQKIDERFTAYLTDESLLAGTADEIAFPKTPEELEDLIKALEAEGRPYCVQGSRTGLVGEAVPSGGCVISLLGMNKAGKPVIPDDGTAVITVEAGLTLKELDDILKPAGLFWPPKPTESSATVGAVAARGSKGPGARLYGETADYILETEKAGPVTARLKLRLLKRPEERTGIALFFENDEAVCRFLECLGAREPKADGASIESAELLERSAISLVEAAKETMTAISRIPTAPENALWMVILILTGSESGIEDLCGRILDLAEEAGADVDASWAAASEAQTEAMETLRHAVTECGNRILAGNHLLFPEITRLESDEAYPGVPPRDILKKIRAGLEEAALDHAIYGHAGETHLQVCLMPKTKAEWEKGRALLGEWIRFCRESGGKPCAEHGYGKVKAGLEEI